MEINNLNLGQTQYLNRQQSVAGANTGELEENLFADVKKSLDEQGTGAVVSSSGFNLDAILSAVISAVLNLFFGKGETAGNANNPAPEVNSGAVSDPAVDTTPAAPAPSKPDVGGTQKPEMPAQPNVQDIEAQKSELTAQYNASSAQNAQTQTELKSQIADLQAQRTELQKALDAPEASFPELEAQKAELEAQKAAAKAEYDEKMNNESVYWVSPLNGKKVEASMKNIFRSNLNGPRANSGRDMYWCKYLIVDKNGKYVADSLGQAKATFYVATGMWYDTGWENATTVIEDLNDEKLRAGLKSGDFRILSAENNMHRAGFSSRYLKTNIELNTEDDAAATAEYEAKTAKLDAQIAKIDKKIAQAAENQKSDTEKQLKEVNAQIGQIHGKLYNLVTEQQNADSAYKAKMAELSALAQNASAPKPSQSNPPETDSSATETEPPQQNIPDFTGTTTKPAENSSAKPADSKPQTGDTKELTESQKLEVEHFKKLIAKAERQIKLLEKDSSPSKDAKIAAHELRIKNYMSQIQQIMGE